MRVLRGGGDRGDVKFKNRFVQISRHHFWVSRVHQRNKLTPILHRPSYLIDDSLVSLSLSLLSRWRRLHSSTDLKKKKKKSYVSKEAFTPGVKWRAATECHQRRDTDSFCLLPFSASRHQAERRRSRPVEVGSSPHGQDGGDVVNGLGSPAAPWK